MSNSPEERKGTQPSRTGQQAEAKTSDIDTAAGSDPLSLGERNRLHRLRYTKADLVGMSVFEARRILNAKIAKDAHVETPIGSESLAQEYYALEAIEARQAGKPIATAGLEIRVDEFTHKCIRGEDPLDATLLECQEAYPDSVVRLINPDLPPIAGTAPQQIYRKNGTKVEIAGLQAMHWPNEVYDREFRQPNLKRSQTMAGQAPRAPGDTANEQLPEGEARYVPLEGKGLQIERNLNTF